METARLTKRLVGGDPDAFREFHTLYFDRLYRFLMTVTYPDSHAAQEALQTTLLNVARRPRYFASEDDLWNWLRAVARNAARDGARKSRRYASILRLFGARIAVPHDRNCQPQRDLDVEGALEGLASMDRKLVEGKYLHELSIAKLAADTGLTIKAVESRLLRSRRALSKSLQARS